MRLLCVIVAALAFHLYGMGNIDDINAMTLEQKIAQLIVPGVYINNVESIDAVRALIVKYECGGILLLNDITRSRITPCEQACIVFELQQYSRIPLVVMQDCEWPVVAYGFFRFHVKFRRGFFGQSTLFLYSKVFVKGGVDWDFVCKNHNVIGVHLNDIDLKSL